MLLMIATGTYRYAQLLVSNVTETVFVPLLLLINIIAISIYYYKFYTSLWKLVPWRVEGRVDLVVAVKACNLCPRLYITVAVIINTTARCGNRSPHCQACYH